MPVLECWNMDESLWPRRVSIVSLIHYSGKNAVFLPPDEVLPMVIAASKTAATMQSRRLGSTRDVAGVSRGNRGYLKANADRIAPSAYTRAIERMDVGMRKEMRAKQVR